MSLSHKQYHTHLGTNIAMRLDTHMAEDKTTVQLKPSISRPVARFEVKLQPTNQLMRGPVSFMSYTKHVSFTKILFAK